MIQWSKSINGENRLLGTDEPVEFEKQRIEVQDFRKKLIILEYSMQYTST